MSIGEHASMESRVLQVASSFTSVPIAKSLRPLLVDAGITDDMRYAQYAQMSEYMLGSAVDAENVIGTIVLVRVEDWLREDVKSPSFDTAGFAERARQKLRTGIDEFAAQLGALARRGKPVWFLACPSAGWIADKYKLEAVCRTHTNLLMARVRNLPKVMVVSWPASWPADPNDRSADRLGQIPFTIEAFHQLGEFLGQQIAHTIERKPSNEKSAPADGSPDLAAYLASLRLRVRLTSPEQHDRTHVDRLLRTAAAFSLTGEKPDLADADVDDLLKPGRCLLIFVSDRLSDHGPSGLVAFREEGDALIFDSMALSCPVLGKQVEYATLAALAQIAVGRGAKKLVFEYSPSPRNQPTLTFLRSVADAEADTRYVVPVNLAEQRIQKATPAPGTWMIELPTYLPPSNGQ
jgi:hypothetical protein